MTTATATGKTIAAVAPCTTRPTTSQTSFCAAAHTTETLVEHRDDLARILECVEDLPDDRREALIMRFALGMDNREIARALGRTDGATKVLLHRAIRQLEGLVKKAEGPVGAVD